MKIKKLVILLSILLSSCATKVNQDQALDTWLGSDLDSLIRSWGAPQSGYGLVNGDQIIEYKATSAVHLENHTTAPNNQREIIFRCVTRFTVSSSRVITNWSREGNDCKAQPKI